MLHLKGILKTFTTSTITAGVLWDVHEIAKIVYNNVIVLGEVVV